MHRRRRRLTARSAGSACPRTPRSGPHHPASGTAGPSPCTAAAASRPGARRCGQHPATLPRRGRRCRPRPASRRCRRAGPPPARPWPWPRRPGPPLTHAPPRRCTHTHSHTLHGGAGGGGKGGRGRRGGAREGGGGGGHRGPAGPGGALYRRYSGVAEGGSHRLGICRGACHMMGRPPGSPRPIPSGSAVCAAPRPAGAANSDSRMRPPLCARLVWSAAACRVILPCVHTHVITPSPRCMIVLLVVTSVI